MIEKSLVVNKLIASEPDVKGKSVDTGAVIKESGRTVEGGKVSVLVVV